MKRRLNIEKKTREQVMAELQEDSATWELFGKFPSSHPERLEQFISDVLGDAREDLSQGRTKE